MKYIETILKLAFLVGGIYVIATSNMYSYCFLVFLIICMFLGITLVFNKEASYNFKQTKRDLTIRKIEGVILLAFSGIVLTLINIL